MHEPLGIFYRREAYAETERLRTERPRDGRPQGIMGREVASRNFLEAVLRYGRWSSLEVILESTEDREPLVEICKRWLDDSPSPRRVRLQTTSELPDWLPNPTAEVVAFPYPPEQRFAELRATHGGQVAFCGMTHTLCSPLALRALARFLDPKWRSYDRLVCTSQSVVDMVRDTTTALIESAAERGQHLPPLQIGLELIPLGVDHEVHRPATPGERFEVRRKLGIGMDRLVLLFVGRLSHHAKAHPYPLFAAAQRAAEATGQEVFLVQCGWYSHPSVRDAYDRTAQMIAPNVRLITVDGMDAWWRRRVWDAADIFVSLADSVQETFGLTVIEAMSRGLPVVASDWNGYRDTVVDGHSGFLIPSWMIRGSAEQLTTQLLAGQLSYDHYLAQVSRRVAVSISDAADCLARLATDADLRRTLGVRGRQRAVQRYSWPVIVQAYEAMWQSQRDEMRRDERRVGTPTAPQAVRIVGDEVEEPGTATSATPVVSRSKIDPPLPDDEWLAECFPGLDACFRGYPTHWLDLSQRLKKRSGAEATCRNYMREPLFAPGLGDEGEREAIPARLEQIGAEFAVAEMAEPGQPGLATSRAAWLLKFGLVDLLDLPSASRTTPATNSTRSEWLTFVTTSKGRLNDLKQTLPRMASQSGCRVVVVDYSCPQGSGKWVRELFPYVTVVDKPGHELFDRSDAKNSGVIAAETEWVCLIDADITVAPDFASRLADLARPGIIARSSAVRDGTGGTFMFERRLFDQVGGHDPLFVGWGEQDEDLVDALRFAGAQLLTFPSELIGHIEHDDHARTKFHTVADRRQSQLVNRTYRGIKWDWSRLIGRMLTTDERHQLRKTIEQELTRFRKSGAATCEIVVESGHSRWAVVQASCRRQLRYRLHREES